MTSTVPTDHYTEAVAKAYDDSVPEMFLPAAIEPAVDVLAELAGDGAALEFGIGTGRVALPLTHRGVPVHGIDLSPAMLARLKRKAGADRITVTLGDFATTRVPREFRLVFVVFNTIMNLTTQDAQVACFANAAAHLEPGGYFLVEVSIPQLQRLPPGETVRAFHVSSDHLGFDEYDVARQGLVSHHYRRIEDQWNVASVPFRYVWPAELDLMAQMAGLTLCHRWEGWARQQFRGESVQHVSVWQKPRRPHRS